MAVRKRARKASSKRTKKSSSPQVSSAVHSGHGGATARMIRTALLSVLIIAFVVWFSQDFQAEGHAYRIQLELEEEHDIALAVATSCQSQDGCTYVKSVASSLGAAQLYLHGEKVDPYQLVYYNAKGSEVSGASSLDFVGDGVVTVGYFGKRHPASSLSVR